MTTPRKSYRSKDLVKDILLEMTKVIENDTEVFLEDSKFLLQLNTNESLKLSRLQDKIENILIDSLEIKKNNARLRNFENDLTVLENQVMNLETIAKELDQWSLELLKKK